MDQNWEKKHLEHDKEIVKRVKKRNTRSMIYLFLGLGTGTLALIILEDMLKEIVEAAKGMTAQGQGIDVHKLVSMISMGSVIAAAVFVLLTILFMFRAMLIWEKGGKHEASRYRWKPDEEEIAYIESRFDNKMVHHILDNISPTGTESIEVRSQEVRINSIDGTAVCNFKKCGYSHLDNYGTKQMAYYLASHAFPEGFVIYQTKIAPVGTYRYIGGVTDVGGEKPPAPDQEKRLKKMFTWLAGQLQKILKLKKPLITPEPEPDPPQSDSGQIVVNKGFNPDMENLMPL